MLTVASWGGGMRPRAERARPRCAAKRSVPTMPFVGFAAAAAPAGTPTASSASSSTAYKQWTNFSTT